ncbi:hypothetical protein [Deinococcus sp. ME38]|uniref:hypothetical protein n=1 Tax=Deinococcus sp. ME38 TaxID=3400344 RepID=UPI003B58E83E
MAQAALKQKLVPLVAAERCVCCGTPLPTGQGYDVPYIGAVGPKCVKKFGVLAEVIAWVDGRSVTHPSQEALAAGTRLIVALRELGFEVMKVDGVLRVTRRVSRPADVTRSYKRRRAELVQDLQVAQGLFGEDAQRARLRGAA